MQAAGRQADRQAGKQQTEVVVVILLSVCLLPAVCRSVCLSVPAVCPSVCFPLTACYQHLSIRVRLPPWHQQPTCPLYLPASHHSMSPATTPLPPPPPPPPSQTSQAQQVPISHHSTQTVIYVVHIRVYILCMWTYMTLCMPWLRNEIGQSQRARHKTLDTLDTGHWTEDRGHRTQDTGHRTQDTGHRTGHRPCYCPMSM
jgi:hypothetical protein